MMVSDKLKEALEDIRSLDPELGIIAAAALPGIVRNIIPRIVALERCRKLLEKYQWSEDVILKEFCSSCICQYHEGHKPDCEIAKALAETTSGT